MADNASRIKLSYEDPNTERIIEHSILYEHEPVIEINEGHKMKMESGEVGLVSNFKNNNNTAENGPTQKGVFKCFECSFSCPSTLELAVHYQIHRANHPFKCFQCGYEGKSKESFLEHSISHIENNFYKCSKCKYKTSTLKSIRTHISLKHDKPNGVSSYPDQLLNYESRRQHSTKSRKTEKILKSGKQEGGAELEKQNIDASLTNIKKEVPDSGDLKMFTCPTCYFIFPSEKNLSQHDYSTHIKNWKVKKATRPKYTGNLQKMTKKLKTNQGSTDIQRNPFVKLDSLFVCPYCNIIFASENDFNDHNSSHNIATDCHLCENKFSTHFELKHHINENHPGSSIFSCINCGQFYATELELQSHLKNVHNTKGILTCPLCPRIIKTEQGLKLHLEAHSKVKSLKCSDCSYVGINPSDLRRHMTKHVEPKYICPNNCGAAYRTLESLTNHIRNCSEDDDEDGDADDEGEEQKDDEMNSDSFEDAPQIEIDISQKDKLICSECKMSFQEPSQLKEHLLIHFNIKPFRCQKCGNRFSSEVILEEHMSSHEEDASVICSICNKHCETSFKLNRHMFTHSLNRPFECSECSLTFETKDNLQNHMKKHDPTLEDEKPIICRICDFITDEIDALKNHILTNHVNEDNIE